MNTDTLSLDEAVQEDEDDSSKIEVHLLPRQDETSIVLEAHLYPDTVST